MLETPVERQTVIITHRGEPPGSGEQVRPAETHPAETHEEPGSAQTNSEAGSRSLKAGGEFVKALGVDLGAGASRVKLALAARHRRPPPLLSARSPVASGAGAGRVLWRASKVLLGVLLLCSGAISAAMLWVIFGFPLHPQHSQPDTSALRAEASNDAAASRGSAANAAEPSRSDMAPVAIAPIQPASSSTSATDQPKRAEQTNAEPQAGATQSQPLPAQPQPPQTQVQPAQLKSQPAQTAMQDRGPVAGQQEASAKSAADQHAGPQCSIELCTATYRSFNAADCTYQPFGGGPRSLCELGGVSGAAARQQSPRIAGAPNPGAPDTPAAPTAQEAAQAAGLAQAGPQCNRSACAATYKSFNAADCTYEPLGGGPRALCALNKGPAEANSKAPSDANRAQSDFNNGPADAPQQASRAAMAPREAIQDDDDAPAAGMIQQVAAPSMSAGPQCNRSRCAATYQSFHASDCTYQPEGGGPRRMCE
jgi:hypothetical protein